MLTASGLLIFTTEILLPESRTGFGIIRPIAGEDWIVFLNMVKYPPSITFLLLTLGTNLLLLALVETDPRHISIHQPGEVVQIAFLEDCLYVLPKQS